MKALIYGNSKYTELIESCIMGRENVDVKVDCFADIDDLPVNNTDNNYDLLYLQITNDDEMNLARKMKDLNPHGIIVLIVNDDRYVSEAFRMNVFQYYTSLSKKEIDYDFNRALNKYHKMNKVKAFKIHGGIGIFNLDDIIYIESYQNNATIYTTKGSYNANKRNLRSIREEIKDFDFVKTISGYIINMNYIDRIEGNKVILQTGQQVAISKLYRKEVLSKIFHFIEFKNN